MINLKQARNDNTLCWNAKIQKVLQSSRKSLCFKCFTFISCSNFTLIFRYSTLRKKCPYSELFWPAFSCILTKYGEILSPYSFRMRENADQNDSEYGHFSRNGYSTHNEFDLRFCKRMHRWLWIKYNNTQYITGFLYTASRMKL